MLSILLLIAFLVYLIFLHPITRPAAEPVSDEKSAKRKNQLNKLWTIAQSSMKERKPLRAEKALLTILKFDEKNAAAYNRLGILYAKERKYEEAIECFEIAQSLDDNASSLHNVGLIYLETGAYEKAAMAFEQALELEGDIPARHIALAKAYEQLGKRKDAVDALEAAYELDKSLSTLRQILALHEAAEDAEAIAAITARIEEQIAAEQRAKTIKRLRFGNKRSVITSRTSSAMRTATRAAKKPNQPIKSTTKAKSPRRKII